MKKSVLLSMALLVGIFLGSCKKNRDLDSPTIENVEFINATPTSVSNGMKNYQSYFLAKTDNKIHGYIISIPLDYNSENANEIPLLVFLHGDWEKPAVGELYNHERLKLYGPLKDIYYNSQRSFPAVIAAIQMSESDNYVNPKVVKEFIDILIGKMAFEKTTDEAIGLGRYHIDLNRIHLTGLSWGGNGVYKTAIAYPNFFASLSVFGGFTEPEDKMVTINTPTYIRHNLDDNMVTVYNAYNAQKWINSAKPPIPVNLATFNASGHDCWSREYVRSDSESVYEWHWAIKK